MNNYITLDGKKYHTTARQWFPMIQKPATPRVNTDGDTDVTYGYNTVKKWQGEIRVYVDGSEPDSGWGNQTDFLASFSKLESVSFTDHMDDTYTVHILGPGGVLKQRALIPLWDEASNKFFYMIELRV